MHDYAYAEGGPEPLKNLHMYEELRQCASAQKQVHSSLAGHGIEAIVFGLPAVAAI